MLRVTVILLLFALGLAPIPPLASASDCADMPAVLCCTPGYCCCQLNPLDDEPRDPLPAVPPSLPVEQHRAVVATCSVADRLAAVATFAPPRHAFCPTPSRVAVYLRTHALLI